MAKPKSIQFQTDEKFIGQRLKDARIALELTQGGLADKAGISRSAVVHYEQGNAAPGGMELIKLAKALNVSPNFILSGSEEFFKSKSQDHALADEDPNIAIARTALGMQALEREVRESISALVMNLVKARLKKKEFQDFTKAIGLVSQSIPQMASEIENVADKTAQQLMSSKPATAKSKTRSVKGGGG